MINMSIKKTITFDKISVNSNNNNNNNSNNNNNNNNNNSLFKEMIITI